MRQFARTEIHIVPLWFLGRTRVELTNHSAGCWVKHLLDPAFKQLEEIDDSGVEETSRSSFFFYLSLVSQLCFL